MTRDDFIRILKETNDIAVCRSCTDGCNKDCYVCAVKALNEYEDSIRDEAIKKTSLEVINEIEDAISTLDWHSNHNGKLIRGASHESVAYYKASDVTEALNKLKIMKTKTKLSKEYVINYLTNKMACDESHFDECENTLCEECPYDYDLSKEEEVFTFIINELSK